MATIVLVLVVDPAQRPLGPCHPARARRLLSAGKAAVWRCEPFTIILKRAVAEAQPQARRPLHDAAAVNATRWALYRHLLATGLPVEGGTGGRTTWNRTRCGLPKAHWIDAACVGASTPERLVCAGVVPLHIKAMGRHSRQLCRTNAFGFPDKSPKATSVVAGMRTGDLVRAVVPATSTRAGVYVGRLAVRTTGSCTITTSAGTVPRCKGSPSAIVGRSTEETAIPTRKERRCVLPLPDGRGLRAAI
jgi:hypothetical protein